jgi:hypothetical protein
LNIQYSLFFAFLFTNLGRKSYGFSATHGASFYAVYIHVALTNCVSLFNPRRGDICRDVKNFSNAAIRQQMCQNFILSNVLSNKCYFRQFLTLADPGLTLAESPAHLLAEAVLNLAPSPLLSYWQNQFLLSG